MYRQAFTKRQAWKLFCDIIAKRHEIHPSHVYALFDGSKRNFDITIETEFMEDNDE